MNMMQQTFRWLALALALAVLSTAVVPVTAQAAESNESAWYELLEYSTVNDSGSNWFRYSSTATVSIPTPYSMRLTKIDMLITYPNNTAPTNVEVFYNGTYYPLEMRRIDANTSRVYGSIQNNFYSDVRIRFTRGNSATAYLEILSCRVSQLVTQEVEAQAQVVIDNTYYSTATNIEVLGNGISDAAYATIRIDVSDWMKFDKLSIWGSAATLGLTSVRATVGTISLPFEMSYIQTVATGETTDYTYRYTYTENYSGGGGYGNGYGDLNTAVEYNSKILYCITIDLSDLDRTYNYNGNAYSMYIYLTGVYTGTYGYTFNCQYVNGSITVPDKTEAAWWDRFTKFFTDLFGGDTTEADNFKNDMQQQGEEVQDAADQIDTVTRPDLDDIDVDIGQFYDPDANQQVADLFGQLFENNLVLTMVMISLMVALAAFIIFGKR